jgi:hypothetical protein
MVIPNAADFWINTYLLIVHHFYGLHCLQNRKQLSCWSRSAESANWRSGVLDVLRKRVMLCI